MSRANRMTGTTPQYTDALSGEMDTNPAWGHLNPAQFADSLEGQGHMSNLNPANGAPAEGPNPYSGMSVNEY